MLAEDKPSFDFIEHFVRQYAPVWHPRHTRALEKIKQSLDRREELERTMSKQDNEESVPEKPDEVPVNLDEWEPPEVSEAGQVNEHGGVIHQVSGTVGVGSGSGMADDEPEK